MGTLIYSISRGDILEFEPVGGVIQIVVIHGNIGYLLDTSGLTKQPTSEFVNMPKEYEEKTFSIDSGDSLYLKGIGKFAINVGTIV